MGALGSHIFKKMVWKRLPNMSKSVSQSCLTLSVPMDCNLCPWNSSGKNTGVGSQSLLQGIFQTKGSMSKGLS